MQTVTSAVHQFGQSVRQLVALMDVLRVLQESMTIQRIMKFSSERIFLTQYWITAYCQQLVMRMRFGRIVNTPDVIRNC